MEAFIIVPCLNEQDGLVATCASLGFEHGMHPTGRLVLVDNGSTDGTVAVMERIRDASQPGSVIIAREPRRGYVPARCAGIAAVLACVQAERTPWEHVLLLQADADTIYLPGYVDAMLRACSGRHGQLLEGCALTNREFNAKYPKFTQLCRDVDASTERWLAPAEDQVVIDDKVSGFSLADYCAWGEHQEEVDTLGRPVYAETTRLFFRAKRKGGAMRTTVEDAQALPSRRKLLIQAPAYFASSGFPRNREWFEAWTLNEETTAFLTSPQRSPSLHRLIQYRQRHQIALFGLLPAFFQEEPRVVASLLGAAASFRQAMTEASPSQILSRVLSLADEENGILERIRAQQPVILGHLSIG